jgi:hypothetical protein
MSGLDEPALSRRNLLPASAAAIVPPVAPSFCGQAAHAQGGETPGAGS